MGTPAGLIKPPTLSHSSNTKHSRNMAVNWEQVNAKLPFARNKAAFSRRKDMWTAIDVNGNGFLSLAEVTKGVRDVIAGDEYIEFKEFRLFLQTLRQFFEYYQAFDRVDTG